MRLFLLLALFTSLFAEPAYRIKPIADQCQGTVSLYAKNLDSGKAFGIRDTERVRTASTIKLPIMAGVYGAIADGKGKLTDELTLAEAEKVAGSGVLRGFSEGVKLPLRDVILLMIVLSDNTATNMILERYPADSINTYLVKFGMKETKSLRKIMGQTASGHSKEGKLDEYKRFGIGVTTPREMVMLLEKLERGEIVSAQASKEMIVTLKRQQDNGGMQRRLNYTIGSKSGALDKLRADAGIVYTPSGRVAMAITIDDLPSAGYKPDNPGLVCIADLAEALVQELAPNVN